MTWIIHTQKPDNKINNSLKQAGYLQYILRQLLEFILEFSSLRLVLYDPSKSVLSIIDVLYSTVMYGIPDITYNIRSADNCVSWFLTKDCSASAFLTIVREVPSEQTTPLIGTLRYYSQNLFWAHHVGRLAPIIHLFHQEDMLARLVNFNSWLVMIARACAQN